MPGARRGRLALAVATALLITAGCATGDDAVVPGSSFEFVAPGGQTRIFYDPPAQRGAVTGLSGESLTDPGRQITLADYNGQVVVLNVWGSWCGPCRAETDDLEAVYAETKDTGVRFLGIDVRDDRSAAQDFVRNFGVTYPSLFDSSGRSLLALKGFPRNTVPSTIVLDRRHRVAAVFLTALVREDLLPVVQRIAAEEPAPSAGPSGTPTTGGSTAAESTATGGATR
ncbi:TlpA disulfide reductase family protein [Lentzea albidocapillata]|uniref:TlpA family protein disulfide reductase n=1 Tax=Lentzea albidocapillata TaxID=40571 RepID=UPI000B7F397E